MTFYLERLIESEKLDKEVSMDSLAGSPDRAAHGSGSMPEYPDSISINNNLSVPMTPLNETIFESSTSEELATNLSAVKSTIPAMIPVGALPSFEMPSTTLQNIVSTVNLGFYYLLSRK